MYLDSNLQERAHWLTIRPKEIAFSPQCVMHVLLWLFATSTGLRCTFLNESPKLDKLGKDTPWHMANWLKKANRRKWHFPSPNLKLAGSIVGPKLSNFFHYIVQQFLVHISVSELNRFSRESCDGWSPNVQHYLPNLQEYAQDTDAQCP